MNCSNQTPIVGELQTLSINRGTSIGYKTQRINQDGTPILEKADAVYFVVKKKWTDEVALITKSIDDMTFDEEGYYHFKILPSETESLPYGTYVWDFTTEYGVNDYRAKPAHGKFIIGNSAGWIANETQGG